MRTGVLLMAYGSPNSAAEVESYLKDIRGGRPIRPGLVEELTDRYAKIGMPSPLLSITTRQAAALQAKLGERFSVRFGMKHWEPRIGAAVAGYAHDGIRELIGIALAPHYSSISIGGYDSRVRAAIQEQGAHISFQMVPHWYEEQPFIDLVARNLRAKMQNFEGARVFFTAHSLPERIIAEGDPYLDQLHASAKLIAEAAGTSDWEFAFQSASTTGEPWLGPDILERLVSFARGGGASAIVAPIGFISDHLEILHDVDIECAQTARSVGLELRRIASPNDDPMLIECLASIVRARTAA